MSGDKLPGLPKLPDLNSLPPQTPEYTNFNESSEENLIELNSEDSLLDEVYEEIQEDDENEYFINGKVISIKEKDGSPVRVIQTDFDGESILIRSVDIDDKLSVNDDFLAIVDKNFVTTSSGIKVYDLIRIQEKLKFNDVPNGLESLGFTSEPDDSEHLHKDSDKEGDPNNKGIVARIKEAIEAMKAEQKEGKGLNYQDFDDEDDYYGDNDYEDEPKDEYKKEPKPKKNKGKKGKRKGPIGFIVGIYKGISMFFFGIYMAIFGFLAALPIIGAVGRFMQKISIVFKVIAFLWLPITLFLGGFTLNSITNKVPSIPKKVDKAEEREILKDSNISLAINKKEIKGKDILIDLENTSSVYSDFYLNAKVKPKGVFKKAITCEGPTSVLAPNETREIKLKCGEDVSGAKIKKLDIIIDNQK